MDIKHCFPNKSPCLEGKCKFWFEHAGIKECLIVLWLQKQCFPPILKKSKAEVIEELEKAGIYPRQDGTY